MDNIFLIMVFIIFIYFYINLIDNKLIIIYHLIIINVNYGNRMNSSISINCRSYGIAKFILFKDLQPQK